PLDLQIPALHVAKLAQALQEGVVVDIGPRRRGARPQREKSDAPYLARRLRECRRRRAEREKRKNRIASVRPGLPLLPDCPDNYTLYASSRDGEGLISPRSMRVTIRAIFSWLGAGMPSSAP